LLLLLLLLTLLQLLFLECFDRRSSVDESQHVLCFDFATARHGDIPGGYPKPTKMVIVFDFRSAVHSQHGSHLFVKVQKGDRFHDIAKERIGNANMKSGPTDGTGFVRSSQLLSFEFRVKEFSGSLDHSNKDKAQFLGRHVLRHDIKQIRLGSIFFFKGGSGIVAAQIGVDSSPRSIPRGQQLLLPPFEVF